MIQLEFSGWFQCRLATDPDPYDEARGVSGYVRAYVNEPGLDRVLYWQAPAFTRPLAPAVGVTVNAVVIDDQIIDDHPLLGARLSLPGNPKFEGRNGVIAEDGDEPIYPFQLRLEKDAVVLERGVVPVDPEFPYAGLFSAGIEGGPEVAAEIAAVTGVADLRTLWRTRLERLAELEKRASGADKVGLHERKAVLESWTASPSGPANFFGIRMLYDYTLASPATIQGWKSTLGSPPTEDPWRIQFWLGGWDADALCGFCVGQVQLESTTSPVLQDLGFRTDDRDSVMGDVVRSVRRRTPGGVAKSRRRPL